MISQISQTDYQKIKEILGDALEIDAAERSDFLCDACAGDEHLLSEIESLLAESEKSEVFLEHFSAARVVQDSLKSNDAAIGEKIGNYRIEREIGRGGMGVVFLATREDFHQQSAIKLIKRGMDSEAVLNRFIREREILAALNHPFIARLTDGGTTDDNLPFFVMEYVEGVSVDEYCKISKLTEKEILELFRKICEAVAFAHQKLIVHRDLKPSNILIAENGTPKLLDFGIAKILDSTNDSDTQTQQRVLTPAYASPEQINGQAIDTTSDVYSLGVILMEMLGISSSKFKVQSSKFKVRNSFDKNSKINSEIKKQSSQAKEPELKGDLRNILAMALREESARRYSSVEKFSEDIRRYLVGLPVIARKDTFSYRASKFIKRKRYAVVIALLFVCTLLGGLMATIWQAREAERERKIAERRFEDLRKISNSFVSEIHSAIQDLPGSLPARQLLLNYAVEQLDALAAESSDNPALQDELAQAYLHSAQLPDMRLSKKDSTLKKAIAIYNTLIASAPENTHYREQLALTEMELGDVTKVLGSVAKGLEYESEAVVLLEQIVKKEPENKKHLLNLCESYLSIANLYFIEGKSREASEIIKKELRELEEVKKLDPNEPLIKHFYDIGQSQMSNNSMLEGDYKSAIGGLRKSLADYETLQAKFPNDTRVKYYLWRIHRRLAQSLEKNSETQAAFEQFRAALAIIESLAAASPNDFGYDRNSAITNIEYGKLLVQKNNSTEAANHFHKAIKLSENVLQNDNDNAESKFDLAWAKGNLGNTLIRTGKVKEGQNYLENSAKSFQEVISDTENIELQKDFAQINLWFNEVKSAGKDKNHLSSGL